MQQPTRTFTEKLFLVLKGLAMGAANKVPGVSGGVVAFVAGFYEEFIDSLQKFNFKALKLLFNFRFKSFWNYINGGFIGLLILGMLISYFSVSKVLDYYLVNHEVLVWSLFFGLIIGSLISIVKSYNSWKFKNIIWLVVGVSVGVLISLLKPATQNDNLFFVFFCGIIGVSGMTLPGLSGSFILMLIGNYVLLLVDAVNALSDAFTFILKNDYSFLENEKHTKLLKVLAVFSLGSITGLVSLSHILGYILKKYKNQTYALIIGFIAGSLGVVWPWKHKIYKKDFQGSILNLSNGQPIIDNYERYLPELNKDTFLAFFWIFIGISVVVYIDYIANKNKKT